MKGETSENIRNKLDPNADSKAKGGWNMATFWKKKDELVKYLIDTKDKQKINQQPQQILNNKAKFFGSIQQKWHQIRNKGDKLIQRIKTQYENNIKKKKEQKIQVILKKQDLNQKYDNVMRNSRRKKQRQINNYINKVESQYTRKKCQAQILKDRRNKVVFIGNTSVGKSSLINKLYNLQLKTGKIQTTLGYQKVHTIENTNIDIYDSQGYNEENHQKQIQEWEKLNYYKIIFILYQNTLKASKAMIECICKPRDRVYKVYFVCTKCDLWEQSNDKTIDEQIKQQKNYLKTIGIQQEIKFYKSSARSYNLKGNENENQKIIKQIYQLTKEKENQNQKRQQQVKKEDINGEDNIQNEEEIQNKNKIHLQNRLDNLNKRKNKDKEGQKNNYINKVENEYTREKCQAQILKDRRNKVVFIGNTSVGKSSLINKLYNLQLKTGKIQTTLGYQKVHTIENTNIDIYDSQGYNEENHQKQIQEWEKLNYYKIIFILYQNTLKASKAMIECICKPRDRVYKVYFVCTKCDLWEQSNDKTIDQQIEQRRKYLKSIGISNVDSITFFKSSVKKDIFDGGSQNQYSKIIKLIEQLETKQVYQHDLGRKNQKRQQLGQKIELMKNDPRQKNSQ